MKKTISLFVLFFAVSFVPAQSIASTGCLDLSQNIHQGNKDSNLHGDIYALQSFLKSSNFLTVNSTGYFGVQTLKAVKAFQKANNITATGFVGPLTRSQIKKISCTATVADPAPVAPPETIPTVPVVDTPASIPPVTPIVPVVEDVILTAPNNSSLRVRTDGIVTINATSIIVKGSITAGARSGTLIWFETTTNPTVYKLSETKISLKKPQRTNNNFTEVIEGLKPETTYYYRACAETIDLGHKSCGGTVSVLTNKL